jgi:PAS domain S-box-containing protein
MLSLERFFDLSSDLLCIAGPVCLVEVNRTFEHTLGYPTRELLSRPVLDFIHPGDRGRTREALDELLAGGQPVRLENRLGRSDGSFCRIEWSIASDRGLLYAAGRDVTDRRQAQDWVAEAQCMARDTHLRLRVLAGQHEALHRVATLVARGAGPAKVFSAVAEEMARCLKVCQAAVLRFEPDDSAIVVGSHDELGVQHIPVGERLTMEGDNVISRVLRTGRAARVDSHDNAAGSAAAPIGGLTLRSVAGAPIVVDGRVWGLALAGSSLPQPLPPDTGARISDFADLVATAVANAAVRAELIASRARIVAAADEARRRLERDLHDGAQQRLVSLGLRLQTAEASVPPDLTADKARLSQIASGLFGVAADLQEISRGIHPAILSKGGLGPAVRTLASRSVVPVSLDLAVDEHLPDPIEIACYYVVAEALTNAAKHARASQVHVRAKAEYGRFDLSIRDDGIGGAQFGKGSGLIGLADRVEALGGHMQISSPLGSGTSLHVTIPLGVE